MKNCSQSVSVAPFNLVANVWLLADSEGRRFLVDTGFGAERIALQLSLRRAGIEKRGDLTAVLLTHRHSDHGGNAVWAREKFGCPILCHEQDAMVLAGDLATPPLRRGIGPFYEEALCAVEDSRSLRFRVDDTFAVGAWRYGFTMYAAFGHTEGSVLIYHEPTKTLFTGDALLSGVPIASFYQRFVLAVPAFSIDIDACRQHLLTFLESPPEILQLCAGHGPFVGRDVARKLQALRTEQRGPVER